MEITNSWDNFLLIDTFVMKNRFFTRNKIN